MRDKVEAFLLREARLLDERRFAEWLALFSADALYWVPTQPGQRSPAEGLSLLHETRALLEMRVARLERADVHVQTPPARTLHQVSGIEVLPSQDPRWEHEARSTLIMAERRGETARWFAGRVIHGLRHEQDKLLIVMKRVDLIDSDAPHRALAVPF
jgi:3-phenylpropionate/cinnamic acid dioxygenase small subunit